MSNRVQTVTNRSNRSGGRDIGLSRGNSSLSSPNPLHQRLTAAETPATSSSRLVYLKIYLNSCVVFLLLGGASPFGRLDFCQGTFHSDVVGHIMKSKAWFDSPAQTITHMIRNGHIRLTSENSKFQSKFHFIMVIF